MTDANRYWRGARPRSVYGRWAAAAALSLAIMAAAGAAAHAAGPLERASIEYPRFVNAFGEPVGTRISINQQVQVMADVRNNQGHEQPFIYIVQVRGSDDSVVSLSWFSGSLAPSRVTSPALSWTPQAVGEYTAEMFVWDGFKVQSPLARSAGLGITVS